MVFARHLPERRRESPSSSGPSTALPTSHQPSVPDSPHRELLDLQHHLGNRAVTRFMQARYAPLAADTVAPRILKQAPQTPKRSAESTDSANSPAGQHLHTSRLAGTGLPVSLQEGIESLSGLSLNQVHVHYQSPRPEQVDALAYTQGAGIYVGPGQEEHLPHEAWHVVQQMQGRVSPAGASAINTDPALENEAQAMGQLAQKVQTPHLPLHHEQLSSALPMQLTKGKRKRKRKGEEVSEESDRDNDVQMQEATPVVDIPTTIPEAEPIGTTTTTTSETPTEGQSSSSSTNVPSQTSEGITNPLQEEGNSDRAELGKYFPGYLVQVENHRVTHLFKKESEKARKPKKKQKKQKAKQKKTGSSDPTDRGEVWNVEALINRFNLSSDRATGNTNPWVPRFIGTAWAEKATSGEPSPVPGSVGYLATVPAPMAANPASGDLGPEDLYKKYVSAFQAPTSGAPSNSTVVAQTGEGGQVPLEEAIPSTSGESSSSTETALPDSVTHHLRLVIGINKKDDPLDMEHSSAWYQRAINTFIRDEYQKIHSPILAISGYLVQPPVMDLWQPSQNISLDYVREIGRMTPGMETEAEEAPFNYKMKFPFAGIRHALMTNEAAKSFRTTLKQYNEHVFIHTGDSDLISLHPQGEDRPSLFTNYTEFIREHPGLVRLGGNFQFDKAEIEKLLKGDNQQAPLSSEQQQQLQLTLLMNAMDQEFRALLGSGMVASTWFAEPNTLINNTLLENEDTASSLTQAAAHKANQMPDYFLSLHKKLGEKSKADITDERGLRTDRSRFLSDPEYRLLTSARKDIQSPPGSDNSEGILKTLTTQHNVQFRSAQYSLVLASSYGISINTASKLMDGTYTPGIDTKVRMVGAQQELLKKAKLFKEWNEKSLALIQKVASGQKSKSEAKRYTYKSFSKDIEAFHSEMDAVIKRELPVKVPEVPTQQSSTSPGQETQTSLDEPPTPEVQSMDVDQSGISKQAQDALEPNFMLKRDASDTPDDLLKLIVHPLVQASSDEQKSILLRSLLAKLLELEYRKDPEKVRRDFLTLVKGEYNLQEW